MRLILGTVSQNGYERLKDDVYKVIKKMHSSRSFQDMELIITVGQDMGVTVIHESRQALTVS